MSYDSRMVAPSNGNELVDRNGGMHANYSNAGTRNYQKAMFGLDDTRLDQLAAQQAGMSTRNEMNAGVSGGVPGTGGGFDELLSMFGTGGGGQPSGARSRNDLMQQMFLKMFV